MKYNVITYKLNKSVKPRDALAALTNLMCQYSVQYKNCLFKASSLIVEYESEGAFHSNRSTNAVLRICKAYPQLNAILKQSIKDNGEGHKNEELSVCNFSEADYSQTGSADPSTVLEIAAKIPRPYNPNNIEIIFDGIYFSKYDQATTTILPPEDGFGMPIGNYVMYERAPFGAEKHSYVHFAADDLKIKRMRELFFEFTKAVSGRYAGTEIKSY